MTVILRSCIDPTLVTRDGEHTNKDLETIIYLRASYVWTLDGGQTFQYK